MLFTEYERYAEMKHLVKHNFQKNSQFLVEKFIQTSNLEKCHTLHPNVKFYEN